eukprot:10208308-Karenia_brevis.AAC.1
MQGPMQDLQPLLTHTFAHLNPAFSQPQQPQQHQQSQSQPSAAAAGTGIMQPEPAPQGGSEKRATCITR